MAGTAAVGLFLRGRALGLFGRLGTAASQRSTRARAGRQRQARTAARREVETAIDRAYSWTKTYLPTAIRDGRHGDLCYHHDPKGQIAAVRQGAQVLERFDYDRARKTALVVRGSAACNKT